MRSKCLTIWVMLVVCVMATANIASAIIVQGIDIDFVTIGNPGNPGDTRTDYPNSAAPYDCGAVDYEYQIGKYEVTNGQWDAFISAAGAPTGNPSNAYDESAYWTGTDVPTNNVSWYEAAQFCNYLTSGDKSQGVYQWSGDNTNPGDFLGIDRATAQATYGTIYFLPTEDEWYKAAYYKPDDSGYSLYANGLNTIPAADNGWNYDGGSYSTPWVVGTGTEEQNGTFDMMGNVWEWNEALPAGSYLFVRGGSFYNYDGALASSGRVTTFYPYDDNLGLGFRVASVPEPTAPPVADADGPYSIYVGDMLTLDASGSTDDDIVSFLWDLDDDESFETDAGSQQVFDVNFAYLQSLGLLINHTYNIHLKVTDSESQSDTADSTLIIEPKPALWVAVDIKPGSCPNPVNVKSSGVLPVAILGTDDYDITTIDPTSIRLTGIEPLRSSFEDVATPVSDANDCNCTEEGPDGFLDLTLKFKTQRIVEAIGDVNDGDILVLELTGVLIDPIPFEKSIEGADCVLIRGKAKSLHGVDINSDGFVDLSDFAIFATNWLQSNVAED